MGGVSIFTVLISSRPSFGGRGVGVLLEEEVRYSSDIHNTHRLFLHLRALIDVYHAMMLSKQSLLLFVYFGGDPLPFFRTDGLINLCQENKKGRLGRYVGTTDQYLPYLISLYFLYSTYQALYINAKVTYSQSCPLCFYRMIHSKHNNLQSERKNHAMIMISKEQLIALGCL